MLVEAVKNWSFTVEGIAGNLEAPGKFPAVKQIEKRHQQDRRRHKAEN